MDVLSDELRELGSTSRRLLERSGRATPFPPPFDAPAGLDQRLVVEDGRVTGARKAFYRAQRFDETLRILRAAWTQERFSFADEISTRSTT